LHAWTGGNSHLVKLAASWLKTATTEEIGRGVASLTEQDEVQTFLLSYITQLLGPDDRAILEAASIFRDRFSDEALAFVSGRTRGEIVDASLRLARLYVATRSKEGDTAFFHTSVRDYIYARIRPELRSELHERAAVWYRRGQREEEADYHQHLAEIAFDDVEPEYSL
jgi:ATP/maltotriose-dependent transcriptional regulator MalT